MIDASSEQLTGPVQTISGDEAELPPLTPWSLLVGILIHPRATFDRLRAARRSHWWLVVVLMAGALALYTYASIQAQTSFASARFSGDFTPPEGFTLPDGAQLPEGVVVAGSTGASSLTSWVPLATGLLGALAGYLLCAVLIFGLGLVMGGKATFRQAFAIAVWSTLPLVLRRLVQGVVMLISGSPIAGGFSGLLTTAESLDMGMLVLLLQQFDVYLLWSLLLLATGVMVTSKVSGGKALMVVGVYVVVTAGLLVAANAASSAISGLLGTNVGLPGIGGRGPRG